MPLSPAKAELVASVIAAAPDGVVQKLEGLVAVARGADPTLEPIYTMLQAESAGRQSMALVFEPLWPLTRPPMKGLEPLLSRRQLQRAWATVARGQPDLAERTGRFLGHGDERAAIDVFNEVCVAAAAGVEAGDPQLALLLRLTPVLRRVQPLLPGWIRNLNGENIASVRLAFKDALDVAGNSGAPFWDALFYMLDEPWCILRLISAATDRPSDRYLAGSELAHIGERLLGDIEGRIDSLKRFDPGLGAAAGAAEARSVITAIEEMGEFEAWLTIKREGPWGGRIADQKKALALTMESRIREVEPALNGALPVQNKGANRAVRPAPKLTADPQLLHVVRAEALLALMEEARSAAAAGGFAALRTKVAESLEKRLDQYCDDLLDTLHKKDFEDLDRVRAYLKIAAAFTHQLKGAETAQIVRRRMAAA